MSKFWDNFWEKVEKFFEPIGDLFDKIDKFMPYITPFLTLVADVAVIYSIYFIIVTPSIPWLWVIPVIIITAPVLYFFNKASIDCIKNVWFKKKEK